MALRRAWSYISNKFISIKGSRITYRDLAGVALGHGPEEVVGKSVLAEAGEGLVINLESRDVG